jgi:DNA repair protein RadB
MRQMEPLSTGCAPVDDLLGGGFERAAVSQVYGPPAAGKTNLCLSAAVEAAADGETAVVVDTEGLSVDRFEQLTEARARAAGVDVDTIARNVVVESAHDFEEQAEAVRDTADFAEAAGLIVLDSATGFYRVQRLEEGDDDGGETLRRVAKQVTHLLGLARRHDLAVAVTNQVYTDPDGDRARPLGGYTLEHWSGTVLRLDRFRGGNRRATVEKHRSRPAGESARFRITDDGLADVDDPSSP